MSETQTIQIRIRVCVDSEGNYNAAGWGKAGESHADDGCIIDGMPGKGVEAWYWVTADVPLPDSTGTIEGAVGP